MKKPLSLFVLLTTRINSQHGKCRNFKQRSFFHVVSPILNRKTVANILQEVTVL
jgi:hypothetical protein